LNAPRILQEGADRLLPQRQFQWLGKKQHAQLDLMDQVLEIGFTGKKAV
jgi:hypothetical protein